MRILNVCMLRPKTRTMRKFPSSLLVLSTIHIPDKFRRPKFDPEFVKGFREKELEWKNKWNGLNVDTTNIPGISDFVDCYREGRIVAEVQRSKSEA